MSTRSADGAPRAVARRALALAAIAAIGAAGGAASVAARTAAATWRALHPPRAAPAPAPPGARDVAFAAADGVRLAAWWIPPRNGAAVVLAHGLGGSRAQLAPLGAALAGAGFGVLLLDLRAHGASGGDRSSWGDRERLDVAAAAEFAAAQPGVGPGAVGALGFSIGALAAAGATLDGAPIAALVLEAMQPSAEADLRATYGRHGALSWLPALWTARALGVRLEETALADRLHRLGDRPVLLVHGAADPNAPPAVGEALRARLGRADLLVVPGGGHGGWSGRAGEVVSERVVAFFEAALLARRGSQGASRPDGGDRPAGSPRRALPP